MRVVDVKIVLLSFCVCTTLAYHHASNKEDYSKWRERFLSNKASLTTTTSAPLAISENDIYYENLKLRHHSRFPNLDRVMLKIDNMQGKKKEHVVMPEPALHNRIRHQSYHRPTTTSTTTSTTTTDEGLFGDDYGDEDLDYDDDDMTDYDDWDDDADEEYDDSDTFTDNAEEWQAEEATEPPRPKPVSSITQYKWDNYGTRSRVDESRRQQLNLKPNNEFSATNAAILHYSKIKKEGVCRKPLLRVISVQKEHPDRSKTYTPHCTILHRCAEDTGCCAKANTKCGPKSQHIVHLYFYTKVHGTASTKVEKLSFYNHTECECLEPSQQTTPSTLTSANENTLTHGFAFKSAPVSHPENLRHCRCPEEFTPKYRYNSGCTCDCEETNQDCWRMKKGKEFISLTDRMCILENHCGTPACEYGTYLMSVGRCPRVVEKLDTYSKITIN